MPVVDVVSVPGHIAVARIDGAADVGELFARVCLATLLAAGPFEDARNDSAQLRRDGRHVRVAGLILLRQKPSTAKGIVFATMEDETGSINLVIFKAVWERFFRIARTSNAWLVDGKLENRKGVIHVVVGRITDLSEEVSGLAVSSRDFH